MCLLCLFVADVPLCPFCGLARSVAVPDLGLRAFLAALHARAARNLFRISRGSPGDVAAFVLCDFGE